MLLIENPETDARLQQAFAQTFLDDGDEAPCNNIIVVEDANNM
jgi:hypothetical protein